LIGYQSEMILVHTVSIKRLIMIIIIYICLSGPVFTKLFRIRIKIRLKLKKNN